jgi:AraC-like DNA-binding protein
MEDLLGRKAPVFSSFSATDWAERDRFEAIREIYGRTIARMDLEPVGDDPLAVDAMLQVLPGLGIARMNCTKAELRRTPRHLVSDDFIFSINLSGQRRIAQHGRETTIGAGDAVLQTAGDVTAGRIDQSHFLAFRMQATAIGAMVANIDDRVACMVPRDTPALKLLTSYASMLREPLTPDVTRLAVTHVHDLVALALGARRDATETAKLRGARAARLREIKQDIEAQLGSESLSIAMLAARHRLPVRYVQRLFESEGASFTEFVLERRLQRAHRLLRDAKFTDRPIGIIAFEAGFTNQPYFNRAFRQRFGAPPSEIRAQACRALAASLSS